MHVSSIDTHAASKKINTWNSIDKPIRNGEKEELEEGQRPRDVEGKASTRTSRNNGHNDNLELHII